MNQAPRGIDQLEQLLGDEAIGHEGRAASSDHAALKLWLRLLACTTQSQAFSVSGGEVM
jgi:hypothetical protein